MEENEKHKELPASAWARLGKSQRDALLLLFKEGGKALIPKAVAERLKDRKLVRVTRVGQRENVMVIARFPLSSHIENCLQGGINPSNTKDKEDS